MKFAHFYAGRSHQFEADPEVTDYALSFRKAERARQAEPFLALAEIEGITDFQKSVALEKAAFYRKDEAGPIIEKIPLESVKKTARMQHFLIQRKAPEVIAQFGDEDFSKLPFWKRFDAYRLRGRAFFIMKNGAKAEADLSEALSWTSDSRGRVSVLLALAQNRERNLGEDDRAFEAYNAIVEGRERIGGADEFYAVQGIARIQTRRGQFDEALQTLNRADPENLEGVWKKNILKSIEEVKRVQSTIKEGTVAD